MINVLFVCMGNICRSPAGEAVMSKFVTQCGLEEKIFCDSAGIIGYHAGEKADRRMRAKAGGRGYNVTSIARMFEYDDFKNFDYILAMDKTNYANLKSLDTKDKFSAKLFMMTDFCISRKEKEVPDPYYGGENGFDLVLDILEDACKGLLEHIKKKDLKL